MLDYQYENTRRVVYGSGATFVPVCEKCHRYVTADDYIMMNDELGWLGDYNATCSKCGRTRMHFEGYIEAE